MREVTIVLTGSFASWLLTAAYIKSQFEHYGWQIESVQWKSGTNPGAYYLRAIVGSQYSKEQIAQNAAHVASTFTNLPVTVAIFDANNTVFTKRYDTTPPLVGVNNSGQTVSTATTPIRTFTPRNNNGESNNNLPQTDDKNSLSVAYEKLAADLKISPMTLGICAAAVLILALRR
jgi:PII-like signaling protein